ncbi:MAG: hypothetical protein IKT29_03975 [Flavobacteriales bacterium]|nr:hypothetical protein [Flavobacteriales bacterium]
MLLETPFTAVARTASEIYETINNPSKFAAFMPDAVQGFKCGVDFGTPWFAFTIGGMPEIKMVRTENLQDEKIVYTTPMGAKVSLGVEIKSTGETTSDVKVYIDADVNPMLRMMVERPLRQFLNDVTEKIKKIG